MRPRCHEGASWCSPRSASTPRARTRASPATPPPWRRCTTTRSRISPASSAPWRSCRPAWWTRASGTCGQARATFRRVISTPSSASPAGNWRAYRPCAGHPPGHRLGQGRYLRRTKPAAMEVLSRHPARIGSSWAFSPGSAKVYASVAPGGGVRMDPVTVIVAALAAGSAAAAREGTPDAVKGAYARLLEGVRERLAGQPGGEMALAKYDADPQAGRALLAEELARVQVGDPLLRLRGQSAYLLNVLGD